MRKGFQIYEECENISPYMRRPLVIYDFALQLLHLEFSHIWGKFDFLFYQYIYLGHETYDPCEVLTKATLFSSVICLEKILTPEDRVLLLTIRRLQIFLVHFLKYSISTTVSTKIVRNFWWYAQTMPNISKLSTVSVIGACSSSACYGRTNYLHLSRLAYWENSPNVPH